MLLSIYIAICFLTLIAFGSIVFNVIYELLPGLKRYGCKFKKSSLRKRLKILLDVILVCACPIWHIFMLIFFIVYRDEVIDEAKERIIANLK